MRNEGKGSVWYALHFYPGIAQYSEMGKDPYRVFLNEDTLRKMDPSFAARPVFVLHVDDVHDDLDTLRGEADGWVTKSFYNQKDGKHWVEFIAVSEKCKQAIADGWRVSNAYVPTDYGPAGTWNGMDYQRQITNGEYEHLAIVPNPRYEESVILSPEQFKAYNAAKDNELEKLRNSKERPMKLKDLLFRKTKVDNAADFESLTVLLPKSKKEISVLDLIANADDLEERKEEEMANGDHSVMVDDHKMKVNELVEKYKQACAKLHAIQDATEDVDVSDDEEIENKDDEEKDKELENQEDEDKDKKTKALDKKENDIDRDKLAEEAIKEAKRTAREKAERLRNAPKNIENALEDVPVYLTSDGLQRGLSRYG
jgi:hypothetical protein